MLQRNKEQWVLYPYIVKGKRNGEEFEQWALPDKEWWERTADKHDHIEIDEFEEIEVDSDIQERFEEIEYMPDNHKQAYIDYVYKGETDADFPTNHPFNIIRLRGVDAENLTDIDKVAVLSTSVLENSEKLAETLSDIAEKIEEMKEE